MEQNVTDSDDSQATADHEPAETARLSARQQRLLSALLTERSLDAACKTAGVARTTAYRWLGEPPFQDALRLMEAQALEATSRGLVALAGKALAVMEQILDDRSVSAGTRVRAADSTLARLLQLRNLVDQEERITALEERMERYNGGSSHG